MRLLIFDLDGTIAHTAISVCEAVNLALDSFDKPRVTPELVSKAMGNGAVMLIKRLLPEEDREDAELIRRVISRYEEMYDILCVNAPVYDGMTEAMTELKRRGYLLAVLSNKQDIYVKKMMAKYFDDGVLSYVQGQTDLPKKPDPSVPLMIAERLGVSASDCAFIGDSDVDIMTAKNAGMIGVGCAWGYRSEELLASLEPHHLIHSPHELLNIFD